MAPTKLWSSHLSPRTQPPEASPGTFLTVTSLPPVHVPALSCALLTFTVLRQSQHISNDGFLVGFLLLHVRKLILFLQQSSIRLGFQHVLCRAAQTQGFASASTCRDGVSGRWGMGCSKASGRASAPFQQASGCIWGCTKLLASPQVSKPVGLWLCPL